ncbi:MAG: alpha-amylase family protein [Verrucomicrobiales bacterium]
MSCRWYKEAIIYSLDVETFKDGNGDGIGDFKGLTQSCRYLSGLGVDCIWLLPFYPSPNRDNGYDVTDYYGIDPRLGTLGDFVEFMEEARDRQLRVMIDLVLNHTSIDHPWFKQASSSRDNPYHSYYVWRYDEPPDTADEAIFPPHQKGVWTYSPGVDGWYMHRFYEHQADLNITHPAVREEMKKVIAFWLKLGVCGFRVDAVPFLIELRGTAAEERDQEFGFLEEVCDFMRWHRGDAVLLAEANVSAEELKEYFGDGNRMQMVFNFLVNQQLFLSFARGSAEAVAKCLKEMQEPPGHCQWGMFLRNHDELSLDRLSDKEREECFRQFGPEENMRLFQRGIRRRLASMLKGDRRRILLAYSLMLSLPGTPVFWYGEEIGMTEDLSQPERFSVRTPMQWSSGKNAGFSSAPPQMLIRPIASDKDFPFEKVNVEAEERDGKSILNAIAGMIRARRQNPEFGCGGWEFLKTNAPKEILAHACTWQGETMVAVHNFASKAVEVKITVSTLRTGVAADTLGIEEREINKGQIRVQLEPFGFRWMRLRPVESRESEKGSPARKRSKQAGAKKKASSRKQP